MKSFSLLEEVLSFILVVVFLSALIFGVVVEPLSPFLP